ncbi:MAG: hypothetical protein CME60_08555, partial [Halobacteriovoraceae bacterium]|nr:hypothetical protein [Halobacteriovoraceae bacterium]
AISQMQSFGRNINGLEANIFWASQSSVDLFNPTTMSAYRSFSGIVQSYSYSKDTVKLVLEDDTSLRISDRTFPKYRLGGSGSTWEGGVIGSEEDVPELRAEK